MSAAVEGDNHRRCDNHRDRERARVQLGRSYDETANDLEHEAAGLPASFRCPRCGRVSYHPMDRREGYCGACHDWTGAA